MMRKSLYSTLFLLLLGGLLLSRLPPIIAQDHISPKQSQANAKLIALWTDQYGTYDEDKAKAVTAQAVQKVIDQGADVDTQDNQGRTSLAMAALNGNLEVAKLLLSRGAQVDARDSEGWTPLMLASTPEVATVLLDHGAKIEAKGSNGNTVLMLDAASHDANAVVPVLLAHGADVHAKNDFGSTPLMGVESPEVTRLLLSHGADLHARDHDGKTPLMEAKSAGVISLLLAQGADADINAQDEDGHTALTAAIGNLDLDSVKLLLDKGADLQHRDASGDTPLMAMGTIGGSSDVYVSLHAIAELLLARGADVNAKSHSGETVLMLTAANSTFADDNTASVTLLLDHGADVQARNALGETALIRAASPEIVNLLVSHGAEINARDNDGQTALMRAAQQGEVEVAKALLAHGAAVDARKATGSTALMIAARWNQGDMVKFLLAHGADVNARNHRGETALEMASLWHWSQTIKIFQAAGARPSKTKQARVLSTQARTIAQRPNPKAQYMLLRHEIGSNKEVIRLIDKTTGRTLWTRMSAGMATPISWSADHRALAISFNEIYESPSKAEFSLLYWREGEAPHLLSDLSRDGEFDEEINMRWSPDDRRFALIGGSTAFDSGGPMIGTLCCIDAVTGRFVINPERVGYYHWVSPERLWYLPMKLVPGPDKQSLMWATQPPRTWSGRTSTP